MAVFQIRHLFPFVVFAQGEEFIIRAGASGREPKQARTKMELQRNRFRANMAVSR